MNALSDLVGVGLYTVPEAAHLTEIAQARVRGWVQGYHQGAGKPRRQSALVHQLPEVDGRTALSFREVIGVRFIRHFLRAGVSWKNIRRASAEARELVGVTGQSLRFSTDGVTVFADTLAEGGDSSARDLVANQYVMLQLLEQSIRSEFDLHGDDLIRAWHPRPQAPLVLLDPQRSFGRPIVEPGVPTDTLAKSLRAEGGDVDRVATLFGVPNDAVRQAATFELGFKARLIVFILAPGWHQESHWPKAAGIIRWMPSMMAAVSAFSAPALLSIPPGKSRSK